MCGHDVATGNGCHVIDIGQQIGVSQKSQDTKVIERAAEPSAGKGSSMQLISLSISIRVCFDGPHRVAIAFIAALAFKNARTT